MLDDDASVASDEKPQAQGIVTTSAIEVCPSPRQAADPVTVAQRAGRPPRSMRRAASGFQASVKGARPPATRIAHAFRAGDDGLALLAFGTRDPNDIVYYPRSGKVSLLDYLDGEPG
jgi:hypothetical protein